MELILIRVRFCFTGAAGFAFFGALGAAGFARTLGGAGFLIHTFCGGPNSSSLRSNIDKGAGGFVKLNANETNIALGIGFFAYIVYGPIVAHTFFNGFISSGSFGSFIGAAGFTGSSRTVARLCIGGSYTQCEKERKQKKHFFHNGKINLCDELLFEAQKYT
jgi:hypothetical protein